MENTRSRHVPQSGRSTPTFRQMQGELDGPCLAAHHFSNRIEATAVGHFHWMRSDLRNRQW